MENVRSLSKHVVRRCKMEQERLAVVKQKRRDADRLKDAKEKRAGSETGDDVGWQWAVRRQEGRIMGTAGAGRGTARRQGI